MLTKNDKCCGDIVLTQCPRLSRYQRLWPSSSPSSRLHFPHQILHVSPRVDLYIPKYLHYILSEARYATHDLESNDIGNSPSTFRHMLRRINRPQHPAVAWVAVALHNQKGEVRSSRGRWSQGLVCCHPTAQRDSCSFTFSCSALVGQLC
ncbi:hypothetical protein J6590_019345 [Homalodisca vitripennis]|nr:hypothetical protein J6590_019345 [Homalodisca vitripennis]